MSKKGILLVNLGTPDSPKPSDVYKYLIEFLTDNRVIDFGWLKRQLLVRGVIVPFRYKQSALAYQAIWTSEGSPLMVYGLRLKEGLQKSLGQDFHVELAMRYQNPSIEKAINIFQQANVDDITVLPLFPQYASATTGSVHQKVAKLLSKYQTIPRLTLINQYFEHPGLIDAFCTVALEYPLKSYDHFLFSFHGLPERHLRKADQNQRCLKSQDCCKTLCSANRNCYAAQCYATANGIIKKLQLDSERVSISFQSRLGKEPWMQPYTIDTIKKLAKEGKKRILVFCPAFVCDCLETIYEISEEYALEFKHLGGEALDLVKGLNDHPCWIEALKEIIVENGIQAPRA